MIGECMAAEELVCMLTREHTPSLAGRALHWGGEPSLEGRIRPGRCPLSI